MSDLILSSLGLLIGFMTWRALWNWFWRPLPEGYEIRTVGAGEDGRFAKVTPFYQERPLTEGEYPYLIYGYTAAIIKARRAIFAHNRYRVDQGTRS
jgi:hypothetical protein